ncbi:flagellar hook-basal body complex protein [Methylobacterium gregans]|uniref:flagellar hook-basal body complex protein n=1 Tax=Methylobacterium gregans TaxID=374424 RepID=UPI00360AAF42
MQNGLYVALSSQIALEKRLTTTAQNVANMATAGYRAEETKFTALMAQATKGAVAFASTGDTYISRTSGPITKTDAPLDVAVQGDAWLSLGGPGGPVYTRDGRLTMDATGRLTDISGRPVLDPGGGRCSSTRSRDRRPSAATARSTRASTKSARSACSLSTRRPRSAGQVRTPSPRACPRGRCRTSPASASRRGTWRARTSTRSWR